MKKTIILMLVFCLLLTAGCASNKQENALKPAQSIEELQQQLEKILYDTHTPGMSVAIIHHDGPEWVAGLGKADVDANRPATQETLFRIGSTSKAFASLSILKLANEGKFSLEDPVRILAPEIWFDNPWEKSDPVRVVDLLEHTTGWEDWHLRELAKDAPSSMGLREALDYDHHSRISRWRPGTRMAYCNSGPAVAAYIVEKITGQHFEDYVTQNFFAPIGMKTATFFQPETTLLTTLYRPDGRTPVSYWNMLYRPAGAINASANDIAAYVRFYLNRGTVNGTQVVPAALIDRMEIPTRTWAAEDGLTAGYGLSSYWNIQEGFVYHGHNGGVEGGLTEIYYLPEYDVGYFYSINANSGEAYKKVGDAIRAYITRGLKRPALPPIATLSEKTAAYAGWYEPDSPRFESIHFIERLLGITFVKIENGKLLLSNLGGKDQTFVPVTETKFRFLPKEGIPDPVATVDLVTPNAEGQFIQTGLLTLKRIPAWFAVTEMILAGWFAIAVISVVIYALFWILGSLSKKHRRPAEFAIRIWPLIAVLSLTAFFCLLFYVLNNSNAFARLGNPTGWSVALFILTLGYAIASLASVYALWCAQKQNIRGSVRRFSITVTMALLIAALYLAYWGVIGIRTWD